MSGLRECPFDSPAFTLALDAPCPVCGDLGGLPDSFTPLESHCVAGRPEPAETRQTVTREEVARCLCETRLWPDAWDKANDTERNGWLHEADAVLSLLRKKGIPV